MPRKKYLVIDTSIILPSFNEASIIVETLTTVAAYIDDNPWLGECEVIVVAAGKDDTPQLAESQSHRFKHLKVVQPPKALGKGNDVRAGFMAASGSVQLFMDADLSTPLKHIKRMVELLRDGIDVVIGERKVSAIHPSTGRRLLSQAGPLASRLILRLPFKDTQCGFKGFRADAAKALFSDLETMAWGFDLEILKRAQESKLKVRSVPINDWHEGREEGFRGQSPLRAGLKTLRELFAIRAASFARIGARHTTGIFVFASLAAGAFAIWRNLSESIWFDEAFTTGLIGRSVSGVLQGTAHDVHPPLYYLILKLWAALFGHSIVTLRVFSVLCGMLSVFVALKLVRRLFGARAALWTVPFVVLAPFLLRYNIEARMYALASLIGISATYVLVVAMERWRAKQPSRWLWIWYAVLVAAGVYTLYYTALIWIAHFLWCLLSTSKKDRNLKRLIRAPWLFAFVGGVILYVPWLPVFIGQAHKIQNGFWISPPSIDTVLSIFTTTFSYKANWQLNTSASFITMLALATAGWFIVRAWHDVDTKQRKYLLLLLLASFVPIIVLFCASLPPLQPVFVSRYVSQTIISGYALLGVAIAITRANRPHLLQWVGVLVLLGALIQGVSTLQNVGNYNFDTVSRPHAKQVMNYLFNQHPEQGTVIAQTSEAYLELHYYAPDASWLRPTVTNVTNLALGPNVQEPTTKPTSPIIWYVYGNNGPSGKEMPKAPYHLVRVENIQGTNVGRYER